MLCPKCGSEIKEAAKFCQECGAKITPPVEEVKEEAVEAKAEEVKEEPVEAKEETVEVEAEEVKETPVTEELKEKAAEAMESAKKAGEEFANSEAVQNAKKEVNDIINEAKVASQNQAGKGAEGETVVPRESVSFLVDWFYWTGRRDRMKYLMVCIVTSLCSLALGSTGIFSLIFCYMSAVNLVKRLHDCDKSGWVAFLLMFAEYIIINLSWIFGLIGLGFVAAGSLSGLLFWIIPLMIVWGIKLWVFFMPGTPGPNRFGPQPK